MRRHLVSLTSLLLSTSSIASAQCVTANGWSAPYNTVRLHLFSSNAPASVQDGLGMAMDAWNSSSCNVGGNSFPLFTQSLADETISVLYFPGASEPAGNGNTVCGRINSGGSATGSNTTIELFDG